MPYIFQKFLENVILSVIVGGLFVVFIDIRAYFILGFIVAVIMAPLEIKENPEFRYAYIMVFIMNWICWPSQIYRKVVVAYDKAKIS